MRRSRRRSGILTGMVALVSLAGCLQSPQLSVSPAAVSFSTNANVLNLFVSNIGTGALSWSVEEVSRASADSPWVASDVPWLTVSNPSGITTDRTTPVELRANRSGLLVGNYVNSGVRIVSNGGEKIVPVSLVVAQTLRVTPESLALSPSATGGQFSVINSGNSAADWDVLYLDDPASPENARPLPPGFLVEPNPGTTPGNGTTQVSVTFPAGQSNFALLVRSEQGGGIVRFRFGSALQGLTVTPSPLTLFMNTADVAAGASGVAQPPSTLRIANNTGNTRNWTIRVNSRLPGGAPPAIGVTPGTGSTPANGESAIAVRVTDVTGVETGSGNYELEITSGDGFLVVPIIIEVMSLPEVTLSEPPSTETPRPEVTPITTLDFGRELVQAEFYVANTGPRDSRLYFRIEYEGQDEEDPLVASVAPLQGDTNGPNFVFIHPPTSNTTIDAARILVTIDRTRLVENVEFKRLTVRAYDSDFNAPLEAVPPKDVLIRVERKPLAVEGAINRSRPPFLMRFVFLLRDSLGRVIPTRTAEDMDRLRFRITEDDQPIDLNETSVFLNGPEDLKVNLAVVLDYSGSMLNAGATGPTPLRRGEALSLVNDAVKSFIDDLPPSYRVALLYHNDRQQQNRVIANFSTDKEALKAALDNFSLPEALFGVTTIRDALMDAIERVAAEDSNETLPFDEADVRAVMFITDGFDNSSIAQVGEVSDLARETRTRLYPLLYAGGQPANSSDMIVLANDTGGHIYNAGNVVNLRRLLANERGLAMEPAEVVGANRAAFTIRNVGTTALEWNIPSTPDSPWISSITPNSGVLPVDGTTTVTVRVEPALIGVNNSAAALVPVRSNNGNGSVRVVARMLADPANVQSLNLELTDVPGTIWKELQNQVVLSYVTPSQVGGDYQIRVEYENDNGDVLVGFFEEDGVFNPGDIRAGQIAMTTTGIQEVLGATDPDEAYRAEIFVRTDYVPRNVNRFRMRFILQAPADIPAGAVAALANAQISVELAQGGLLVSNDPFVPDWRLIAEGDDSYLLLTDQSNVLPYGAFGNLLQLTVTGLADFVSFFDGIPRAPEFLIDMRVDNQLYVNPASPGSPTQTLFFLYPSGPTFPERPLRVTTTSDLAPPARTALDLALPGIDPEAPDAWDRDGDGLPDFNDPFPDDPDLPGVLATPNPLEINPDQNLAGVTLRNNRLDTYSWVLNESSLPSWIERVSYGSPAPGPGDPGPLPRSVLAPGATERINFHIDRTGLESGFFEADVELDTDIFGTIDIPVTLIVITE